MTPTLIAALATGLVVLAMTPAHASRLRAREPPADRVSGGPAKKRRLLTAGATGVAVWFALASLGQLAVGLGAVASVLSYFVVGGLESAAQARRQARLAAELPQVCDLLIACLEAGLPLRGAAEVVASGLDGPMAERLAEVAAKCRLGVAEERAWEELAVEPALAAVARELARGTGSGVALAGRLRAIGLDARRDAFADAEARAKRVGVTSVLPLMACFLPAFVLLGVLPIVGGLVLRLISP
jgi:pilus assembly protein TadC